MTNSNLENRVFAVTGLGCTLIGVFLGLPVAVLSARIFFDLQRGQPPEVDVVYNQMERSWEVETTNPSPVARRVTEVRFVYERMLQPEPLIGAIELEKIVFEQSEYDRNTKTFRKVVHDVEMPANGNLNILFFVRNPKFKNHRLVGRLEVYFDDREEPGVFAYDSFSLLCIE